jgi:hypothetical protein
VIFLYPINIYNTEKNTNCFMDFIKKYTSHEEYEVDKTPNVSLCVENNETKHLHYTKKKFDDEYLTFEALESGTFTLTIGSGVTTGDVTSVSYSLDNGETWTTTNNVQGQQVVITTPTVNAGDEVLWKGSANRMANNPDTHKTSIFSSTANFNARGNVMSLLYGDEFKDEVSLSGKNYCFSYLFRNNGKLINGKNLSLPATTLESSCYYGMFDGCTSLATAPELPATTLAYSCYADIFYGCTSLATAPELPATTLASNCYNYMFYGCTSLTIAPELPATTLTSYCYRQMFAGCTNLTTAPQLQVTKLEQYCYYGMFAGCTSLTVAPELPVTDLKYRCYYGMFSGCTSLTTAPALPATTLKEECYSYMFRECTSLTTAPELPATTLAISCYTYMFYDCANLTTAPELPATTLPNSCYQYMFCDCTSLTTAPELPATTLVNWCYYGMFQGCRSLTTTPELPATTLATYCYGHMFDGCTNLITAPELPATTLAEKCYSSMFAGCTSLTMAPALPARSLESGCYYQMFYGCTSLTVAPELPAISLPDDCYVNMFYNCSSLNYIKALFITDNDKSTPATDEWVYGVAETGTFVKNGKATWDVVGADGVPTGWQIIYDESAIINRYIAIDDFIPEYVEDCGDDEGDTECILSKYEEDGYDFDNIDGYQCGVYLYNGEYIYDGESCYIWEMVDGGNQYSDQVAFILTTSMDFSGRTLEDGVLTYPVIASLNEDLEDNYHGNGAKVNQFIIKQWDE